MALDLLSLDLKRSSFERISKIVYDIAGIYLPPNKLGLVKSRLLKRLRLLNLDSFESYIDFVSEEANSKELEQMIDIITTNKTNFFREQQHFDYMTNTFLPEFKNNNKAMRIWSAGCSSGAEPYTISMVLHDEFPDIAKRDFKILATDISNEMLEIAKLGQFSENIATEVSAGRLNKYFTKTKNQDKVVYQAQNNIKSLVKYAYLNLMGDWPMKGPFDIIFCRNVMIYFDKETRQRLINRFYSLIANNGYLFVGHSESLTSSEHKFTYIQPAVYQKRV